MPTAAASLVVGWVVTGASTFLAFFHFGVGIVISAIIGFVLGSLSFALVAFIALVYANWSEESSETSILSVPSRTIA